MNEAIAVTKISLKSRRCAANISQLRGKTTYKKDGKHHGTLQKATKSQIISNNDSLLQNESELMPCSQITNCEVVWNCVSPTSEGNLSSVNSTPSSGALCQGRTIKRCMEQRTPQRDSSSASKAKKLSHCVSLSTTEDPQAPRNMGRILFKRVERSGEHSDEDSNSDAEELEDDLLNLSPIEGALSDGRSEEEGLPHHQPAEAVVTPRQKGDDSEVRMNQSFSCKKKSKGGEVDSFTDDDMFNDSILNSIQAVEEALYDKGRNKPHTETRSVAALGSASTPQRAATRLLRRKSHLTPGSEEAGGHKTESPASQKSEGRLRRSKSAFSSESGETKQQRESSVRRVNSDSFMGFGDEDDSFFEEIASSIPIGDHMLTAWTKKLEDVSIYSKVPDPNNIHPKKESHANGLLPSNTGSFPSKIATPVPSVLNFSKIVNSSITNSRSSSKLVCVGKPTNSSSKPTPVSSNSSSAKSFTFTKPSSSVRSAWVPNSAPLVKSNVNKKVSPSRSSAGTTSNTCDGNLVRNKIPPQVAEEKDLFDDDFEMDDELDNFISQMETNYLSQQPKKQTSTSPLKRSQTEDDLHDDFELGRMEDDLFALEEVCALGTTAETTDEGATKEGRTAEEDECISDQSTKENRGVGPAQQERSKADPLLEDSNGPRSKYSLRNTPVRKSYASGRRPKLPPQKEDVKPKYSRDDIEKKKAVALEKRRLRSKQVVND